jgi:CDP-glycerol glycerophosphotransferase (TagB/SpsB family)
MVLIFKSLVKLLLLKLSNLIPKDHNLWIIGAWYGKTYNDNSKYLFEYINKTKKNIKIVWLTKNYKVITYIKEKGFEVHHFFSPLALLYGFRAGVAIFSSSLTYDLNSWCISEQTKKVQLWHGAGIKKIYPLEDCRSYSLITASSLAIKKKFEECFGVDKKEIKITGFPRTDGLLQKALFDSSINKTILDLKGAGNKIGIYLPTFRKTSGFEPLKNFIDNQNKINSFFKKQRIHLFIKPHFFYDINNQLPKLDEIKYSNLHYFYENGIKDDLYSILGLVDFLITDYSSVYTDFLFFDKPIIFTPFDLFRYKNKDQGLYFDYNSVTPGPKAKSWNDVFKYLKDYKKTNSLYKNERQRILTFFHQYKDQNNCERVYKAIISL